MTARATRKEPQQQSRMIHVRLPAEVHRRLRLIVASEDTSVQDWVERTISQAVATKWPKVKAGE